MAHVIRLLGTARGVPTPFDGQYIESYSVDPTTRHHGGLLKTTHDISQALRFTDAATAWSFWRQSIGIRPDGKPDAPLTAFSAAIEPIPE